MTWLLLTDKGKVRGRIIFLMPYCFWVGWRITDACFSGRSVYTGSWWKLLGHLSFSPSSTSTAAAAAEVAFLVFLGSCLCRYFVSLGVGQTYFFLYDSSTFSSVTGFALFRVDDLFVTKWIYSKCRFSWMVRVPTEASFFSVVALPIQKSVSVKKFEFMSNIQVVLSHTFAAH